MYLATIESALAQKLPKQTTYSLQQSKNIEGIPEGTKKELFLFE